MSDATLGITFAFVASLCWAFGSILIRLGIARVSPQSATFLSVLAGFVFVALIALIVDAGAFLELTPAALAGFAFVGFISFMGGRFLYYTAVSMIGVGRATAMGGAMPMIASVLAVLFLGRTIDHPPGRRHHRRRSRNRPNSLRPRPKLMTPSTLPSGH